MCEHATIDDYIDALQGVGEKTRENILARAANDKNLDLFEFVRLCRIANGLA